MPSTALLIVDMQNAMFANPKRQPSNGKNIVHNIEMLLRSARESGTPVVFIQHTKNEPYAENTETWQIYPQLAPQSGEPVVQKAVPNGFSNTSLKEVLQAKKIQKLVVTGMQSDCCVKATSLGGVAEGFQVVLASDAHSTFDGVVLTGESKIRHVNNQLEKRNVLLKTTAEILENQFE